MYTRRILIALTILMLGSLTVTAQEGLWLSYLLPKCSSNDPARFYVYTGSHVGQTVVISITMLNSLIVDPNRQEAPYRVAQAKAAIIQPGGVVQNVTFSPKELPGPVEVRATIYAGSISLKGVYKRLDRLCNP